MDYTRFLRRIHRYIVTTKKTDKKHIIRFANPHEYQSCIRQLKKLKPSLKKLSFVKSVHMINALCCSLTTCSSLMKHKGILFIEEDIRIKLHNYSVTFPDYSVPHNTTQSKPPSIPWGVKEIKAPQAWKKSEGKQVKVAVIDTGVDFNHPDLRETLAGGINLVQRNSPPIDDNGHGTHIAGTIAASNQRSGIMGVAPKATLYAIKSFDKDGSAFVSDIIQGIDWCVRNKINIINMSFGMANASQSLRDAIQNAHAAGVILTASSGNDGKTTKIDYPARFSQTIAVGATDKKRNIASFSNRGSGITVFAPGEAIESTWLNNGYKELSGTSMATSHVTGVIALMLSLKPGLTSAKVRSLLKKTALSLKPKSTGSGEVNALNAVNQPVTATKKRKKG